MATVYCGTDTVLRRRVAIKVLREQYAADEEFVRRFYQEAESAAQALAPQHRQHVRRRAARATRTSSSWSSSTDRRSPRSSRPTGRFPNRSRSTTPRRSPAGWPTRIVTGLLHRDIKPANILVTKDDVVKLSDFGIARAVSQQTMALTKPGLVMGSVYYISPEQAQGHELHETSDLYSLGVVLYQMLTGKLPYCGRVAGDRRAQAHRRPGSDDRHARDRRESRRWRRSSTRCCRRGPNIAFNRRANSPRRCAKRANAQRRRHIASPTTRPERARLARRQALPPRRSPMPDRAVRVGDERDDAPAAPWVRSRCSDRCAARRDGARLSALRAAAAGTRARASRSPTTPDMTRRAGAAGGRQRRITHALHQERERYGRRQIT